LIAVIPLIGKPQCLFDIRRLYHRFIAHQSLAGHFGRLLK